MRVDGVRVPVSPRTAQRAADWLTSIDRDGHAVLLLTPALVDLVYCLARWRPRGFTPGDLVAPVGKDWVLADASLVALAERRGHFAVASVDSDFTVYRGATRRRFPNVFFE